METKWDEKVRRKPKVYDVKISIMIEAELTTEGWMMTNCDNNILSIIREQVG